MSELERLTQLAERAGEAFVCDPTRDSFQAFTLAADLARQEFERRILEAYQDYEAALAKGVRS